MDWLSLLLLPTAKYIPTVFRKRVEKEVLQLLRDTERWKGQRTFTGAGYRGVEISELQAASKVLGRCSYDYLVDILQELKKREIVGSAPCFEGTWWFFIPH